LPSTAALNGALSGFTARGVMSMVAGSVDQIASILSISKFNIGPGGALGSAKNTPVAHPSSTNVYFSGPNQTGTQGISVTLGGSLMDGAIVAQVNSTGLLGNRIFLR
jgi:hypothetical protein